MTELAAYKKTKERVDYKSLIVVNKRLENFDPTKTTALRKAFMADMERRFVMLTRAIKTAIIEDDVFGLKETNHSLKVNALIPGANMPTITPGKEAFKFLTSQEKVNAFMKWMKEQEAKGLLQTTTISQIGNPLEKAWTDTYIADSYKRGVQRATYELDQIGMGTPLDERGGISATMSTPFHMDRVGMLYSRVFEDLRGITAQMDSQISRILSQGMVDGDGPRLLAGKIVEAIQGKTGDLSLIQKSKLGKEYLINPRARAMTLARTEIIRAHHSAMVQEYKNWALEGVVVKAEWSTAGFNVCPECSALDGKEFPLSEIEGMIPRHPNCFVDSQIPIYTSEGWKAIGKVKVGDYVLTHEKRFKKVYALPRLKGNENTEVITFKFKGDVKISITANHPIQVKKGNRLIWKEAGKCTTEDKVMFLADTCQRCNTSVPYFRKYCSRTCLSLDITDKQWANPEHRKNVSEKNSIANKLQYASGERDRFETTRKANEKTRKLVKEGNWILQEKWVHDKSNEVNNTPEQRKASSDRMKANNPMSDPIIKAKTQEALRIVYQKFPEKRLNARMARLRCSGNMTWIEKRMADLLDRIGIEYISQYPILNYNADFVIPSLRIVIECDGEHWHKDKEKDAIRQNRIEDEGWFVLRYTGTKINQCIDEIGAELLRVVSNHRGKYNTVNWEIESIKRWNLKTNRTLYNLSVEDDESYIAKGLIVHNCRCIALPTMPEKGVKTVEKVQEGFDMSQIKPDETFLKSWGSEHDLFGKWIAEDNKISLDELKVKITGKVQDTLKDAMVIIRVPDDVLPLILKDERFLSQFEATSKKAGSTWSDARIRFEKNVFGYAETEVQNRPIYGLLSKDIPNTSGDQYGNVLIQLKSDIKKRTTVTFGDTMDITNRGQNATVIPSLLSEPTEASVPFFRANYLDDLEKMVKIPNHGQGYTEVQMHGGVTLKDIETIHFYPEPPIDMQDQLKKLGIKWELIQY